MADRPQYNIGKGFETFPFPAGVENDIRATDELHQKRLLTALANSGETYYDIRSDARSHPQIGKTIGCRVIPLELLDRYY